MNYVNEIQEVVEKVLNKKIILHNQVRPKYRRLKIRNCDTTREQRLIMLCLLAKYHERISITNYNEMNHKKETSIHCLVIKMSI